MKKSHFTTSIPHPVQAPLKPQIAPSKKMRKILTNALDEIERPKSTKSRFVTTNQDFVEKKSKIIFTRRRKVFTRRREIFTNP